MHQVHPARPGEAPTPRSLGRCAFVASTGRTATMLIARVLDSLDQVTGLHEGHRPAGPREPRLPLINYQNRLAWHDPIRARAVVDERRSSDQLAQASGRAEDLVVDVAFYNAALVPHLIDQHPSASVVAIARRCEGFVRSATIVSGEDLQPAGWPDPDKPLTDRERFIELGRLRPAASDPHAEMWDSWSGVSRNIWLWYEVNRHLLSWADELDRVSLVRFEDLRCDPVGFWTACLEPLGLADPERVAACVTGSLRPVNARSGYQVGPATAWDPAEQELYERLALPLEELTHG